MLKKQARSQEGAAIKPAYASVAIKSMGIVNNSIEYEPFGEVVTDYAATGPVPRLGWIGKERDAETGYENFGVRNYDFEGGRFLSGDALWEEYRAWGVYHYSHNNPGILFDRNGLNAQSIARMVESIDGQLDELWKNTQRTGNEWGGTIVRLDLTPDGLSGRSAQIEKVTEGGRNGIDLEEVEGLPNGRVEGRAHTHPNGTSFSRGDLHTYMVDTKHQSSMIGNVQIVETGDVRFALEVVDPDAAYVFATQKGESKIYSEYDKAYNEILNSSGSFREATLAGVVAVANSPNSGIKVYVSTNAEKTQFREVR